MDRLIQKKAHHAKEQAEKPMGNPVLTRAGAVLIGWNAACMSIPSFLLASIYYSFSCLDFAFPSSPLPLSVSSNALQHIKANILVRCHVRVFSDLLEGMEREGEIFCKRAKWKY